MKKSRVASILVVDDNSQNLQLLGSVLQERGYDVAFAMNGKEALDYLTEELPDLILLDVMMPGMDGFEVCRDFKKVPDNKNVPVIFLTAKTETEDIVHGFECGAVDYISKPFQAAELLARVHTHVELKRAREEIISLKGLLPICAGCKKIRDDDGFWLKVETYLTTHTDVELTHGLCPDCYQESLKKIEQYRQKMQREQ